MFRPATNITRRRAMDSSSDVVEASPAEVEAGTSSKSELHSDIHKVAQSVAEDKYPPQDDEVASANPEHPAISQEKLEPWDKVNKRIRSLQMEKAELKAKAKAAAKEMRAAQRAKRRTARNAKRLSDEELVQIVMERKMQEEVAKQVEAEAAAAAAEASGLAKQPATKQSGMGKTSGRGK